MQTIREFNSTYKTLFGNEDDRGGGDEGPGNGVIEYFTKRYGWIHNTREVAIFECITMAEVWELPVKQVLFDLMYLKAKAAYDKEKIKQLRNPNGTH